MCGAALIRLDESDVYEILALFIKSIILFE